MTEGDAMAGGCIDAGLQGDAMENGSVSLRAASERSLADALSRRSLDATQTRDARYYRTPYSCTYSCTVVQLYRQAQLP